MLYSKIIAIYSEIRTAHTRIRYFLCSSMWCR